jgi:hypothetical protein
LVYEEHKDFENALDVYKKIKQDYPQSQEASLIDAYIARAEARL